MTPPDAARAALALTVAMAGCTIAPPKDDPGQPSPDDTDLADTDTSRVEDDTPDTDLPDTLPLDDAPAVTGEVCYLGADRRGATCLPVVDHDPAWGPDWAWPVSADPRYAAPLRLLDLQVLDPATALAPNFRLSELAQAYKGRFGVVQPGLIAHLQAVRDAAGGAVVVSSGFRNPAYNAGVGGVILSRHQWGDAADLQPTTVDLAALGDLCVQEGAAFFDLYEAHVHCDWRDDALSPAFFAPSPRRAAGDAPRPDRAARLVAGAAWTAPASGWDEGEPLREWTALDDRGTVILAATGRQFAAPPSTRRVTVRVGGHVTLTADVP